MRMPGSRAAKSHDDEDAEFTAFALVQSRPLFRTAWVLTGDWHFSEDLVQETLGRLYRAWDGLSRIDNPAGYAQTVLVRTFLSDRRRHSSGERTVDHILAGSPAAASCTAASSWSGPVRRWAPQPSRVR